MSSDISNFLIRVQYSIYCDGYLSQIEHKCLIKHSNLDLLVILLGQWRIAKVEKALKTDVRPATLLKRHSVTGVFLWVLRNF